MHGGARGAWADKGCAVRPARLACRGGLGPCAAEGVAGCWGFRISVARCTRRARGPSFLSYAQSCPGIPLAPGVDKDSPTWGGGAWRLIKTSRARGSDFAGALL